MAFNKLNIVRDCWWVTSSGSYANTYIADENLQQPTYEHGLYKSLNSNDAEYIQFQGSGTYPAPYYFARLESTNIVPEKIMLNIRASGDGETWAYFGVNSGKLSIDGVGYFGGVETKTFVIDVDEQDKQRILQGRVNKNYDYCWIYFANSGTFDNFKLYDLEVYYSGQNTWTNYTAGLPNVLSVDCYPDQLKFYNDSAWINQNSEIVDASGYYHINMHPSGATADNAYIEHYTYPTLTPLPFYRERPSTRLGFVKDMPNGGLGIRFNVDDLDPITQVTRAQITLRMSLPPSGLYENARDCFEVNGYNERYSNRDYRAEMRDAIGTQRPLASRYGYFAYGAGQIVEQSGFKDYTVELDFTDGHNILNEAWDNPSTVHRNIDIFNEMVFQLVGLPSGTQLSAARLYLEYLPNETLGLYTVGGFAVIRHNVEAYVDINDETSFYFGDGSWQHYGNLHEGEIFDAFYRFDEASGIYTYPKSLNAAAGASGVYVNAVWEEPIYEDEEIVDIIYTIDTVEPTRKNIYRDPVRTEFGGTYDPTHYRTMIYNQSPFTTWNIHDPDATAYSSGVAQVYFDDTIALNTDFTLYFMLYREPTNQGQNFAQFFQRSVLGSAGSVEYEILGILEPEKITFAVKNTNDITQTVSVDIPAYSIEPILIWTTCGYDADSNESTLKLNVHKNIKNYFYEDWLHDEVTFTYPRKLLPDVKTMLGPMYTPDTLDQQLAFTQFFSWTSIVEFGWADSVIELDYQTTDQDVQWGYDYSVDNDKRFLASRLCNSEYLHGRFHSLDSIGGDPILPWSSGWTLPQNSLSWGGESKWILPQNIRYETPAYAWTAPPYTLLLGRPSDWLFAYDFGFDIPSGQVPVGLEVTYRCHCTPDWRINTHRVQLGTLAFGSAMSTIGTRQENTGPTRWRAPEIESNFVYGGTNNTWGVPADQFTRELLNSSDFGVGLQVHTDSSTIPGTAYVSWAKVRVYTSGDSGLTTIENYKYLHWNVPYGSGAAEHDTSYIIDHWRNDEHSLFNPITTAGTHHVVHPSAIYVEIEAEHNTDHPSGVKVTCDIEFDSGATDNWKVFRTDFEIPSGELSTRVQGFTKHLAMNSEPIRYSDVDQINLTLHTHYADLGAQEYFGEVKIKSIKVYFDSYSASVTGIQVLDLYVEGGIGEYSDNVDLYLLAADVDSNNLDLYISGIPYYASGEMPLFTEGMIPSSGQMPLYIKGIPFYESGQMPLFTKAITWTPMTLYIEGLDPPEESGNVPLYVWATPAGVGGLYKQLPLVIGGQSPWHMPLYLLAETPPSTAASGSMTLMINSASGINETVYLYTKGHEIPTNTLSLYTTSAGQSTGSVDLYTSGSGLPETKTTTIYTHGY